MAILINSELGEVSVDNSVIASIAGAVATKCYGVVGMASKKIIRDGWAELLKIENYSRGVVVKETDDGLEIDLYIIVSFGVKISEVVQEAQKKVKYVLEKSLSEPISCVNVYVQGVQVME